MHGMSGRLEKGGGLYGGGAENCTIVGNSASDEGGGVFSTPMVSDPQWLWYRRGLRHTSNCQRDFCTGHFRLCR